MARGARHGHGHAFHRTETEPGKYLGHRHSAFRRARLQPVVDGDAAAAHLAAGRLMSQRGRQGQRIGPA